eukprot:m.9738 g.9738  ORF g.9738 m.9738 type:complete len:477 (+) comp2670_c0_seq2:2-1432(+)
MTLKYNNAFLGIRRNSTLSRELLELICRFPKADHRRNEYCAEVGDPCHEEWYYNHGPQQWAVDHGLGLLPLPLGLFDPANDCFARGLLSGSGAYRMKRDWPLATVLELFRGAFTLHTRSYQVKTKDRPLRNDTMFGSLFNHVRTLANRGVRHHAIVPYGNRNASQVAVFNALVARNRPYTPPDPTFTPQGPASLVFLTQTVRDHGAPPADMALGVATLVSNGYAKTFALMPRKMALAGPSPAAAWLVFEGTSGTRQSDAGDYGDASGGFIMPATTVVTQTYCVDMDAVRHFKGRPSTVPDLNHCDPRRDGQRWDVVDAMATQTRHDNRRNHAADNNDANIDNTQTTTTPSPTTSSHRLKRRASTSRSAASSLRRSVRFQLRRAPTTCLGLGPVANPRWCGSGTMMVTQWNRTSTNHRNGHIAANGYSNGSHATTMALPAPQCLMAAIVDCAHPSAVWDMEPAEQRFGKSDRVLRAP